MSSEVFRRLHILALQAFIDDSLEGNTVLVLAGYIASSDDWNAFEPCWQERLDIAEFPYFKMSEFAARDGRSEVAGWFYRAIEKHARAFIVVAIEIEPLRNVVKELGFKDALGDAKVLEDPYMNAFSAIIDAVSQYQHELGFGDEPIEIIFDNSEGQEEKVRLGFDAFKEWCPEEQKMRLGRRPRFEDDREFLPLQAADLLAWHARKQWLRDGSMTGNHIELPCDTKVEIRGYRFNFGYNELYEYFSVLKISMIDAGFKFDRPDFSMSFAATYPWDYDILTLKFD